MQKVKMQTNMDYNTHMHDEMHVEHKYCAQMLRRMRMASSKACMLCATCHVICELTRTKALPS